MPPQPLAIFGPVMTLTSDLLNPKSNQVIFVPKCTQHTRWTFCEIFFSSFEDTVFTRFL